MLKETQQTCFIIFLSAIPLDKELYRVKRKGLDADDDLTLARRVRRSDSGERQRELRKKRRFFTDEEEESEKTLNELYENKMAARSSRSSREDDDVTATPGERFKATSGSGSGFDDAASGSGLWMRTGSEDDHSDPSFPKIAEKRSARVSNLEKLVSALNAIGLPDATGSEKRDDPSASGSGLWSDAAAAARRTKLARALADVAPVASGSGDEEATEKRSVVIHLESDSRGEIVSPGTTLVKREVLGETLANQLVQTAKESSQNTDVDEKFRKEKREFLDDFLEASVERERRAPLPPSEVESDADSLVVRFYRDQEMQESEAAAPTSLPSESPEEDALEDPYSDLFKAPDSDIPKVISKKEISGHHEPIIEMPAVYSPSAEDDEMDSSDGGPEADQADVPIEVHERHIEDDGMHSRNGVHCTTNSWEAIFQENSE